MSLRKHDLAMIYNHNDPNNGKVVECIRFMGDKPIINFNGQRIISLNDRVWEINICVANKLPESVFQLGYAYMPYIPEKYLMPIGRNNQHKETENEHNRRINHAISRDR